MKEKIIIYTDGAARGNPGPAGWGAVILFSQNDKLKESGKPASPAGRLKIIEIGGRKEKATNNQMELIAPIEALKFLRKHLPAVPAHAGQAGEIVGHVEIYCDSQYVILGITIWIQNWIRKNWRNAAKKPVINRELWEELYELNQKIKPKWTYVEGHTGNKWNERADEIATNFADDKSIKLKTKHHAG